MADPAEMVKLGGRDNAPDNSIDSIPINFPPARRHKQKPEPKAGKPPRRAEIRYGYEPQREFRCPKCGTLCADPRSLEVHVKFCKGVYPPWPTA